MKTALQKLIEECRNYQKESGNNSISIDLLEQGVKGIYGNLEKQQIIEAHNAGQALYSDVIINTKSKDYFEQTFNQPLKGI